MIEITVELGPRRYAVFVDRGLVGRLPRLLAPLRGRPFAVLASRRVWKLHRPRIAPALSRLRPLVRILLPDGERHKSRATLDRVHDAFARAGLPRDGVVLAIGGGVTSDMAGFAAATYMRGVDWVPVPTTLLAMVDGAIGGKTGINHPRAKNLIGAFHQPRAVVADTAFLDTLPPRERTSGTYEVLKCAIIGDPPLFEQLRRDPTAATGTTAIATACRLKADVVARDEREDGLRRVLNLGHTVGHALESATHYRRFTHGEAVGWGLLAAAWMARARGLLAGTDQCAIEEAVDRMGPRPRVSDISDTAVLAALGRDKKRRAGRLVFVLPTAIGQVEVHEDVRPPEVRAALRYLREREEARPRLG